MIITRTLEKLIKKYMFIGKAIIIYGPRQAGKTTIVKNILKKVDKKILWLNGDEYDIRNILTNTTSTQLKNLILNNKIVVIDEAQRIENIGITIKLIVDNFPDIQVIATGSSSFDLANKITEPLTGRKFEYLLLPFSFEELVNQFNLLEEKRLLEDRLIYGSYPEVVTKPQFRKEYLKQIADNYLYKDILIWENIKKPQKLEKLVQTLSFQVGSEVSYNELGQFVSLDNETVEKYIDLLEKSFVIFQLNSFSRNLRNELKKSKKIYFYDNGLRNAVINNFNSISSRNDKGILWENYIISERIKFLKYNNIYASIYFWRTTDQKEIDYIEDRDGKLYGFEFKWNIRSKAKIPKKFLETYPNSEIKIITPENYETFLFPSF